MWICAKRLGRKGFPATLSKINSKQVVTIDRSIGPPTDRQLVKSALCALWALTKHIVPFWRPTREKRTFLQRGEQHTSAFTVSIHSEWPSLYTHLALTGSLIGSFLEPLERRMHSPMSTILSSAAKQLRELCDAHQVDASHGIDHAKAVLANARAALVESDLNDSERIAVQLAALLHDADDRKYFREDGYGNATAILRNLENEFSMAPTIREQVLRMIELVSCSKNGNSFPADCEMFPHLLWPRWADRLEAIGEIGIVRCYLYTKHTKAPLCTENTPKPQTVEEVLSLATPARFAQYQKGKASSASFMDHFYDKLIQITCPPTDMIQNKFFQEQMAARREPLINLCLSYGKTGHVPVQEIEALVAKYMN